MTSIFSVAAIILAVLGPGETKAGYTAGWSAPDRMHSTVGFGMPRLPRPKMPRPSWP